MAVDGLLWILAVVLVGLGVAGTVLPVLPGAVLVFAGLLLAAWLDGFTRVGAATLTALGLLTAIAYGVDLVAGSFGAQRLGASRRAVWGAVAGAVVGLFFGLPGIVAGPFVGAAVGEYSVHGRWRQAGKVGAGTWIGMLAAAAVKVALVFAMLALFAAAYVL